MTTLLLHTLEAPLALTQVGVPLPQRGRSFLIYMPMLLFGRLL